MRKALSRREVENIAALAHLTLTDAEVDLFARQLGDILAFADTIRNVDTTGVPPTAHVLSGEKPLRPDEVSPSLPRDQALAQAPDAAADVGLFRVPRVLGG